MRGLCDTCDQVSELFQMTGRTDLNCAECHATIGMVIQLFETFREVQRAGGDTSDLSTGLKHVFGRLVDRIRLNTEASAYQQ